MRERKWNLRLLVTMDTDPFSREVSNKRYLNSKKSLITYLRHLLRFAQFSVPNPLDTGHVIFLFCTFSPIIEQTNKNYL
jgi:hypothetical protein